MVEESEYGAGQIQVLEGLNAVRKRPAMYIGSTDSKGLHHLVYEVVDNSIDEALAGYCDEIEVTIHPDNSVTVSDNGRGIPVDAHDDGMPAVQVIMQTLHAGGKFDAEAYQVSGGLHGVGISVVNALSTTLDVNIRRDGKVWHQSYEYAEATPDGELEEVRDLEPDEDTGTTVRFWPDDEIFTETEFDYSTLRKRLRELAFLNPGVSITITDLRPEEEPEDDEFLYEGGIKEYVEYINESREQIHDDVIYFEGEEDDIAVEIAMQATSDVQPAIHSFANNINTREGGTHMTGFKSAITRIINDYAKENEMLGELDGNLKGEDVREGLTTVISVKHPDPQFEGQTKTKLANGEVRGVTEGIMHDGFSTFLEENPNMAEQLVERAKHAAKARKAANKAEEVTRRDSPLESTSLPGKLTDCQTKDPEDAELFIVEGDSAGGSAKQARNPENQAVLPLKGKIINVEKHRLDRILENTEIRSLVTAMGGGVGEEFNINDIRYKNLVILTDADVDGAHIRTLLLTFIYRYMTPLLEQGHVYAAKPPLYRIRYRGETYDAMTEAERDEIIEEKCNGNPSQVQRFKGLGEMNPKQLWDSTMDPEKRRLKRLTVEDGAYADKIFSTLMGDSVQPRKEFIRDNAQDVEWVDV